MRKNRVMLLLGMLCCLSTATRVFGATPINETHASLSEVPAGAVEVGSGTYTSALLGKEVPYRIFCPVKPDLTGEREEGMPVAIYTMNLTCPAPRPSSASDREIIEDFIKRQFIVVAVDFSGGTVTEPLEWSKDIHGLAHVFGGTQLLQWASYTETRQKLVGVPGVHAGREITSVPSPSDSGSVIPINYMRIYPVPPGYTVDYRQVFNSDTGARRRKALFFDIIYPMPSDENLKLPVLLAQSSFNPGATVITDNALVLYSWLFNGYAFASTKNMPVDEDNLEAYPIVQAIRYLRWKADDYSLNGVVSTAGISKAARRVYRESNFDGRPTIVDDMPYGKESSKVSVTMPAVSTGPWLDDGNFDDFPIWEHLNENAPAVVLGYHHLNPKDVEKYQGQKEKAVRDAYLAKGWEDKLFYREVPIAAHEYNIYDLNEIMAFWDKFCKNLSSNETK